jgi:hypothetical protein
MVRINLLLVLIFFTAIAPLSLNVQSVKGQETTYRVVMELTGLT